MRRRLPVMIALLAFDRLFGNWQLWLGLAALLAVGHFAIELNDKSAFLNLVGSMWFSMSTLSPFLVVTALGRARRTVSSTWKPLPAEDDLRKVGEGRVRLPPPD